MKLGVDRIMPRYIKSIEAEAVLGRFDIYQEFQEGVNVLYGKNGTGKTTLLHILANLLNGDYKRFAFIDFKRIQVRLDDDTDFAVSKDKHEGKEIINISMNGDIIEGNISIQEIIDQEELREVREERVLGASSYREKIMRRLDEGSITPVLPVAYFPAFRTMIEAWASSVGFNMVRNPRETRFLSTIFARELFGSFVPSINYPSPTEIENKLREEIEEALLKIARADRENFGELVPNIFQGIFQVLSPNSDSSEDSSLLVEKSEDILKEIDSLVKKLEDYPLKAAPTITQLRTSVALFQVDDKSKRIAERVLKIYREALKKVITVQEDSFRTIEKYLKAVNSFLEGKNIEISLADKSRRKPSVGIKFDEGNPITIRGIRRALSSGEREIVTLIYAATHMSKQQIVLIDEPEISLHVDWQRKLLQKMSEQLGNRQIIVCTHSPVIGGDYEDQVIIFEPKITCSSKTAIDNEIVDEDNEVF
ncbi:AAA family ATPase [Planktothrix agardhii]